MATPTEDQNYIPNVISNNLSITHVKSTSSSLAGAFCGLLGLTNLSGFILYLLTSLTIGLTFTLVNCHGKPDKYFAGGWTDTVLGGLLENAFAFVLFWTLFYAIVHIYD